MILRKIWQELEAFRSKGGKEALLLDGARQVGKTYIVRRYAERYYKNYVEINFIKNEAARKLFEGIWNEKEFFVKLSALTEVQCNPGETLVFFDEVQVCPEVVTYIKFLVDDGRFHYILSGSLLGVELKDIRSAPVGYLREVKMFPLDLEEFSAAVGLRADVLSSVREHIEKKEKIDARVHEKMMKVFRLYLVVGGMPAAVQAYLDTQNIQSVIREQKGILAEYRKDATRYDEGEKMRILRVMEILPSELNRENKRFYASDIKKGEKFERVEDNFVWLAKAGIALPVYNVDLPRIPLELAKKSNLFKLFMNAVGLLAAQYMDGIQLEILNGNLDVNFGAVFENFVAEELTAHGYDKLYYFNSKKHGEVDFLVEKGGAVLPLEVKSGSGYKSHAALDNMMAVPDYGLENAVVYNTQGEIEDSDRVAYLPIYALMFLSHDALPTSAVYKLDL